MNASSQPNSTHLSIRNEEVDALELAGYQPSTSLVDQQATAWFLAWRDGLSKARHEEWQAWLHASPEHAHAWHRCESIWHDLESVPRTVWARSRPASETTSKSGTPSHAVPPLDLGRRAWMVTVSRWLPQAGMATAAGALVSGALVGWDKWLNQATFQQSYATKRGQLLTVDLPDGSRLQLDTSSQVSVTLYRQRREVHLVDGQALFHVAANAEQPFDVLAGPLRITVLGTRFSVRHLPRIGDGGVQVNVEEGRVRVAHIDASHVDGAGRHSVAVLMAGQALVANANGYWSEIEQVNSAGIAPWREGRVAFNNTPLSSALAEFERYSETGLRINDPSVANLQINGSFDVHKVNNFAHALTRVLPLKLRNNPEDGTVTIVRAP